ncbi:MAG: bidirectional hydrogenase complex protein HoxU [Candidatus Omnitrophica bacterium]|nr:bidirectional hydrogenase complex protein HoxU [Candidatus Omnitrophota bacterium]
MSTKYSVTIDGKTVEAGPKQTILDVCKTAGVDIMTLCYLEGVSNVGACRLCLVEVEGTQKLLPACTTTVAPNQKIQTNTDKLKQYRKMTLELFFSERNHICSVCVANNNCQLQNLAREAGVDHIRFPYIFPEAHTDASHKEFMMDHNRCILCTRCVRVCDEVEGAHTWDVMGRGYQSRIISDFDQPWGDSSTCTSCGKCVEVCPVGALWPKDAMLGHLKKSPEMVTELVHKRKHRS